MDVCLLSFPPASDRETLRAAHALAEALRERGAAVTADIAPAGDTDAAAATLRYRRSWRQRTPAVIHAIGVEAAEVALEASPGVPVVVSFVADEPDSRLERDIAGRADALLVGSSAERRVWQAAGVAAAKVHTWHLPTDVPDADAVTPADGAVVVTDARGRDLDVVRAAAKAWRGTQLVVVGGIAGDSDGGDESVVRASVAIATRPSRRGGLAARAARHGVPTVVLDRGLSTDQVVDGASGLVLRADASESDMARAVSVLLRDRLLCRGFGMAALLRVKATRNADVAAERALAAYETTVRRHAATQARAHGRAAGESTSGQQGQRLAEEHLDLASQLARRYDGRGQSLEDLVQVANLGLVQAARRFDPERGSSFAAFAVPTILGELKRYFRDQAWSVRVPRPVQEAALEVDAVARDVEGRDGHVPTAEQLAQTAKLSRADVREAQRARAEALSHASLNRLVSDDDGEHEIGDSIGEEDEAFETVEARAAVRGAMASLSEREREVVAMRFFGECTQSQIAERLGVSQVQVSRLLRRTMDTLRTELTAENG